MSVSISDYRNSVEQPWGRMFYDLVYRQLVIPNDRRARILDFGAGFCITAGHYAEYHDVTAVEPNSEMYGLRVGGGYTLVTQGAEYLSAVEDGAFDAAICHNVLEYADDRDIIVKQLARVVKPGGVLSIVKHNLFGRALACAVFSDDPGAALDMLSGGDQEDSMFGKRSVYGVGYLLDILADDMVLAETYGIRAFYGLSSNNGIKFSDEWYRSMLELETKAGTMDEYKKIAFFNHLIFRKK